jgi:hypothetical protein
MDKEEWDKPDDIDLLFYWLAPKQKTLHWIRIANLIIETLKKLDIIW